MSKPRLCEILGVDVSERFRFKGFGDIEFEVSPYGYIYYFYNGVFNKTADINYLCEMVKHPEWIIHKPKLKWTKQDVEDAKAIKRLMPWVHRIGRDQFGMAYVLNANLTPIDASCFKGLKQDEEVELDEILNSEL